MSVSNLRKSLVAGEVPKSTELIIGLHRNHAADWVKVVRISGALPLSHYHPISRMLTECTGVQQWH